MALPRGRRLFAHQLTRDVDLLVFFLGTAVTLSYCALVVEGAPFVDDWELCTIFQRPNPWTYVLEPHNEHVLILFKLIALPVAMATKWDARTLVWIGLPLFFAGQLLIFLLVRNYTERTSLRLAAALILCQPAAWENLIWGWQLQVHLCLFFACAALWIARQDLEHPARLAALSVCFALALASFGAGVGVSLAGAMYLAWRGLLDRPHRWRFWITATVALGAVVAYQLLGHSVQRSATILLPWPDPVAFLWKLAIAFGNGIAFGYSMPLNAAVGAVVAVIIAFELLKSRRAVPGPVLLAALSAVATAVIIAVMRGNGPPDATAAPRYRELGVLLVLPLMWSFDRIALPARAYPVVALAFVAITAISLPEHLNNIRVRIMITGGAFMCIRDKKEVDPECARWIYHDVPRLQACVDSLRQRWGSLGHLGAGVPR